MVYTEHALRQQHFHVAPALEQEVALWIVQTHYEKAIVTDSKLYVMSTVSLLEQRIALYKSDQYASGGSFLWHLDLKIWLLFCHDIVNEVNQTSDCILLTVVL